MILKELLIKKPDGMQQVDAQNIVKRAMRFDSDIFFEVGTRKINAKSLMGVISMGLKEGDKVMVIVKGDDQDEALEDLINMFERNFRI